MSFEALALTEGPLAAAYLLTLGALAAGMIEVPKNRQFIARNCFLASCIIFAGMGFMWGITTATPLLPRMLVVGVLFGLAGIAAVESSRFIMPSPESKPEAPKIQSPQETKAIEAGPVSLSQLSDTALQRATIEFAGRMRVFETNARAGEPQARPFPQVPRPASPEDMAEASRQFQPIWDEDNRIRQEYQGRIDLEFRNNYLSEARVLKNEIETRLVRAGKFPPYLKGKQAAMEQLALFVFDHGSLGGPRPISDAADYLEIVARRLTE